MPSNFCANNVCCKQKDNEILIIRTKSKRLATRHHLLWVVHLACGLAVLEILDAVKRFELVETGLASLESNITVYNSKIIYQNLFLVLLLRKIRCNMSFDTWIGTSLDAKS